MARPSRGFSESIGIWKCWFLRRGENWSTRRKISRNMDEKQQQTQPTFDAKSGNRTRATLVGGLHGRQMLNHCAIPAPLFCNILWCFIGEMYEGEQMVLKIVFTCITSASPQLSGRDKHPLNL